MKLSLEIRDLAFEIYKNNVNLTPAKCVELALAFNAFCDDYKEDMAFKFISGSMVQPQPRKELDFYQRLSESIVDHEPPF